MKSVRFFNMKPGCRIFLPCKNAPFLVIPFPESSKFSVCSDFQFRTHKFHTCSSRFSGFKTIFNNAQRSCSSQNRNWGQSGILSNTCRRDSSPRSHFVIGCAASNIRDLSTSVETHLNDKNFERIYVHGGLNAKPLAVEKIDLDSNATINEDEIKSGNLENDVKSERLDDTKSVRAGKKESEVEKEAWRLLRNAIVTYCGSPVGTLAANDPNDKLPLNYDQVFIRDFVPSAFAFLLKGGGEIVRNFLLHTLQLQSWEKTVDCYSPGQGLMPASFKVRSVALDDNKFEEVLDPDFGESAIGRVAPMDSGLWWIILLRAYGKLTGDYALQERVDVQTGIKLILNLWLSDGFDMFPSLLVTDGSCMIDRRIITGSDPKNTPWSYHNGGSWPTLLWQLSCSHLTTMSRSTSFAMLSRRVYWPITEKTQPLSSKYCTMMHSTNQIQSDPFSLESPKDGIKYNSTHLQHNDSATSIPHQIGENVPRKDKITFLVKTLMDLKDSKEVVYGTLDAWVAWERNFPIGALKNVLLILEKDQQWHRMIQVIKWMLSKGQGNTRGTFGQLIQALDMDDRAEEAYEIWKKKLAFDLHSVPWKLCKLMISIYYRNNRLEDLVKLFKGLEDFDRKPPEKSIVRKVADAYELLGKPEDKERILEKYKDLFTDTANGKSKKHSYSPSKRKSNKKR